MIRIKTKVLFGFLVWLIPFVVSFLIFPLKTSQPSLFESIMPVVITICVVVFSLLYFKKVEAVFLQEGVWLGLIWLVISLALDLLLFMEGPMKMSLANYVMDIGLTYLMIPTMTLGFGYALERQKRSSPG